jgi:hypothetical protein
MQDEIYLALRQDLAKQAQRHGAEMTVPDRHERFGVLQMRWPRNRHGGLQVYGEQAVNS